MNFKKTPVYALIAASAIILTGCAQVATNEANYDNDLYMSAWVKAHYGDIKPVSEYGYYVLDSKGGEGSIIGDIKSAPYVYVEYTGWTLDGGLGASTSEQAAKQLGTYQPQNYYGPVVWSRRDDYPIAIGFSDILGSMKAGETMKAAIPGWLLSSSQIFSSYKEYFEKASGTNAIYEITLKEAIPDIIEWQKDSIKRYMAQNDITAEEDETLEGFFFQQYKEPENDETFSDESEVYLNYVLRRLDNTVLDTNIEDTAKVHHIYTEGATYAPVYVNWNSDYTKMTMGSNGSEIITGFQYGLSKMKKGEKARFLFVSSLGYKFSGSGNTIPAYSPLRFDIEMIGKAD